MIHLRFLSNQETKKQLEVARASLDKLKKFLSQQLERFQQLARESKEVLQLKTDGKNIVCEIAELKQRMNELNLTMEIEKEAKMKSLVRIRERKIEIRNEKKTKIEMCSSFVGGRIEPFAERAHSTIESVPFE